MKKIDNFSASLDVLAHADFQQAHEDVIYRTGIVGQFNLTFELAWKALQAVLRAHNVIGAESGSPLSILKLGYKTGFLSDSEVWILMHKKGTSPFMNIARRILTRLLFLSGTLSFPRSRHYWIRLPQRRPKRKAIAGRTAMVEIKNP